MSVQALSCAFAIRGLSPSEKLVLLALANYADPQMRCFPSHSTLAEDTGLSDRTVLTVLKTLEAKRIVSRQQRRRDDGSRSTDIITMHFAGETISPPGEIRCAAKPQMTALGGEIASPQEPRTNHQIEEPLPEADASAGISHKTPDEKAWEDALGVLVGQGGMKAERARAFFGGLLKAHGLEPRDLLGALGEAYRLGTKDPQGYLKAAAMSRNRRRSAGAPEKRLGFV